MQGAERTTRQRIADVLREDPAAASILAAEFGITTSTALTHVEHISRSLETTEEELLAAPPACRDCGFDRFEDLTNRPSGCPACKSEDVTEPTYTIR